MNLNWEFLKSTEIQHYTLKSSIHQNHPVQRQQSSVFGIRKLQGQTYTYQDNFENDHQRSVRVQPTVI